MESSRELWTESHLIKVLDSVGIGEMPDAAAYGDKGSDTTEGLAKATMALGRP